MNAYILNRAMSALGKGTIYALGKGGRRPLAPVPHDDKRQCDCSGFVAWSMGVDRYQPRNPLYARFNGGWVATTSLVYDAGRPRAETGLVDRVDVPEPGDVVVYRDYTVDGVRRQGHCGIISYVPTDWAGDYSQLRVIHCSASKAARLAGSAIQETPGTLFGRRAAIFARYYAPEPSSPAPV